MPACPAMRARAHLGTTLVQWTRTSSLGRLAGDASLAMGKGKSAEPSLGRVLVVRSERQRGLSSDARSRARAGARRLPSSLAKTGEVAGLGREPRFPLPERLCAVRDEPGVPAVAPVPGTFPGGCYGTRRASWDSKTICLQALGRPGAVPVRRPGRGCGYGPVPAGRWALTPRARRNSAAPPRVAAS